MAVVAVFPGVKEHVQLPWDLFDYPSHRYSMQSIGLVASGRIGPEVILVLLEQSHFYWDLVQRFVLFL